jgi:signal transduction histidine kinase/CheY-like chemotaxis protein
VRKTKLVTVKEVIRNCELFWQLSDSQIDKVAELCQEESYKAGECIFNEGDSAHNIYIVNEGKVALEMEVRIGQRTRKQAVIDVIVKDHVFGWSALSEKEVFTMSAICVEDTKLFALDGKLLKHCCNEDSDLCKKVMYQLVNVVENRLSHAKRTLAHVLSVTSHDLRAPLATVQSCLDVIAGGFVGDINSRQKELIEGSKQRISDLVSMIDNILDISYIEIRELDFENVALSEIIESSVGDVTGLAQKKGITLISNVSPKLPKALGIPKRLRQVLTNLLSNGIKFTPDGGTVSIDARETDDCIQVEVADTGIGISPEELPRIFDDFYRGMKVDAEGAGLGLSIAKKIVNAHGGNIWAESPCPESGIGSKLSFNIPKVSRIARGKAEEEEGVRVGGERILVTDDDPEMLRVVTILLEAQGYQVFTAKDGEEALTRVEKEKPDLLILDLLMPRMDGFEVCKRLDEQVRAGSKKLPILILSAVREGSSRRRYELETKTSLGIDDYVEKPISPPVLIQKIERLLRRCKSNLQ